MRTAFFCHRDGSFPASWLFDTYLAVILGKRQQGQLLAGKGEHEPFLDVKKAVRSGTGAPGRP